MTTSPEYVAARAALLDALDVLGPQRAGLVLVGAQAVYLRAGDGGLAVTLHTTDADLGVRPELLAPDPELAACMTKAGFRHDSASSVGIWISDRQIDGRPFEAQVDLLVPDAVSGRPGQGKRSPEIPPHDPRAARIVRGLEGALFDFDPMTIASLSPADSRAFEIAVAGPAALVVAKAHKIKERLTQQKRAHTVAKDALDVARLLRGCADDEIARRWRALLDGATSDDPVRSATAAVAREALDFFAGAFAVPAGPGCKLALDAAVGAEDPDLLLASITELSGRVVRQVG